MVGATPARWTPRWLLQGLGRTFKHPLDVPLCARIGWFVWRLPARLEGAALPELLAGLRASTEPRSRAPVAAADVDRGVARVARLRQAWLNQPRLASRNTCYVRAITLYRFLDPGARAVRLHFGVEPDVDPRDRLRGHAWVTVGGRLVEPPEPVVAGRVRELYAYPERGDG